LAEEVSVIFDGMQPYVSSTGLVPLLVPHVFTVFALVYSKMVAERLDDWQAVTPGYFHWFACLGIASFSLLIAWVWAFVGSARHDAASQMLAAWWLALSFGFISALCAWRIASIARASVHWRGDQVRWRSTAGSVEKSLLGVSDFNFSVISGYLTLQLTDGTLLKLDEYAIGAGKLIEHIVRLNGIESPEASDEA
jgi:hypothetical protein